ncbi:universal stress protein [Neolewinella agarilytica]|uniref:Universal stress protein family protein n=1 Tax=Neolewinella agarilytica TaxID=478744 RepID=A0A1H9EMQ1_9BACT|nr:universal stress protein [Neolewinella agarilytica]SEQ27000.1 Universal stress protein family protein [Neolewinella agarilytica]
MSSLLIPVDFSIPCHNAYRFGLHLAKQLNLDVVLAHYYSGSLDPDQPLVFGGDGSLHGNYIDRLRQFAYPSGDGDDYPLVEPPTGVNLSYETAVSYSPSASIINRANESDIRFVVMAPRSSKSMLNKWLGSTSITVSESCKRPVLLIPEDVDFRPIRQIVVANNHATADAAPLSQLRSLANLYGAMVHFVHVEWPDQYMPLRFVPWRLMEELVEKDGGADYPFEVITVEEEDITKGLLDFADQVNADLVAIVNKKRSRWRSLIHASLTQDMALRTARPLLVLHAEEAGDLADEAIKAYSDKTH